MITIFIIIIFLVAVSFILRFEHTFSKIKLVFILIVLLIIMLSAVVWINRGETNFSSPSAVLYSVVDYFSWAKSTSMVILNVGKEAIKDIGSLTNTNTTRPNSDGRK